MPLNALVSFLIKKRLQQIQLFRDNPGMAQLEVFLALIQAAKYTEWGRKYHFASITNPDVFRSRVPLQDYNDLKPVVQRLRKGEQNITWPTDVRWFAKSSGTTNDRSKFIPVSREALEECHYKGGKDLIAFHYQQFPESNLYKGKSLVVGGSSNIEQFRTDAYSGDLSAIIIRNLPIWVEVRRTPVMETALMDNWEVKIEQMARETMREDVTCIAGVPSWTLVLMKRILELTGKQNILEVWPNLELFMHGGVSFRPYRTQFEALIPSPTMNYLESYNASEGSFAVQDRHGADDMLLMLDYGIFYEFIPLSELDNAKPRTLLLHEVELDTHYAIVISTNAGLWRYMPGDTVRFTSLAPHRVQVSGRTKSFINAFGEELIVENADKGIQAACDATGAVVNEYTAGPIYMDTEHLGGHEWIIEFKDAPHDPARFVEVLDMTMRQLNSDYDAKRKGDMALVLPIVHAVAPGTFYEWMKQRGKLGGQNKVPRLSNDRTYLDALLVSELA
ncbi:MAG: GH3 auxin-responsive promoter family protein [Flavobacteriales bacterium]|nr:GH3 auxin-responsive promoter family protein [Flavobacteriales bacterium]MBK6946562.1 GH3 auxin-responsive promoter family protein [Flavobacteriales bacterium]MBK7239699.1 GH3 auxin-responsive promoter family protein [Flavobacteriales bacterium]MBK7298723.1 GH3 auxin-responsive promoter family protein [Flavobacteriales bacterium]MBK9536613.1 GH3 auxin-responsive promoter family protein [Flavobacteriales bacterium]